LKNHLTVGVYSNNSHVVNVVKDCDLKSHIEYNEIFRPGRLLFVDGKYQCGGEMFSEESLKSKIEEWELKIKDFNIDLSKPSKEYK